MKKVTGRIIIGNNVTKVKTVTVYSREEAKKILNGKDWRISEDLYDMNTYKKIATGIEWDEVVQQGSEKHTYTTGLYYI